MNETYLLFKFIGFMLYGFILLFLLISAIAVAVVLAALYLSMLAGNRTWRWMQTSGNTV